MIVEGAKQAFLREKVPVESPKNGDWEQEDRGVTGGFGTNEQGQQTGNESNGPALELKRVHREASDHAVNEFKMLELWIHMVLRTFEIRIVQLRWYTIRG